MGRIASAFCAALLAAACSNASEEAAELEGSDIVQYAGPPAAPDQPQAYVAAQPANVGAAPGTPQQMKPGSVGVVRADVFDRNGFEKPIKAITILLPAGWTYDGAIVWKQPGGCAPSPYDFNFRGRSPDGATTVSVIPQEQWQWTNQPAFAGPSPCPTLQIQSVQAYLEHYVARARQGARIIDFRRRPDAEQKYQQLATSQSGAGTSMRTWIESGDALIAYNNGGAEMREIIGATVMFTHMHLDGMSMTPPVDTITAMTMPGFTMSAPNGQLDFRLAEMIRTSGQENPEWTARMAKYYENLRRINAKASRSAVQGAADRSSIIARTGDEIREMQMDSWRRQNESSDYIQRESSEAIRGVETYNDPYNGGTVELDNTYDYNWQLNDGSYVQSNNPNFDPNVDLGLEAQQLEVTE